MTGSFPTYDGFNIDGSSPDGSYFHLAYLGSFDFGFTSEECHGPGEDQVCHEWGSSCSVARLLEASIPLTALFSPPLRVLRRASASRIGLQGLAMRSSLTPPIIISPATSQTDGGTVGSAGWVYDSSEGTEGSALLTTRSSTPEPSSIASSAQASSASSQCGPESSA
jgi:hypothetical protein